MVHSYRDLLVWQKSVALARNVYDATAAFPRREMFGLTSQMRRAAVSIASNVAEGKAAGGMLYPRHIRISLGSNAELETQLELSTQLKLLEPHQAQKLIADADEVGRMLSGLLASLRKRP